MAKERNLPSKTTLTASDFIRVVGSDNASYKQPMTDLMSTTGITRAWTTTGVDLNTLTPNATSGNGYYRGNDISTMTNRPSAEINARPWALDAINVNSYIKQILHVYTAQADIVVYERIQRYSSGSTIWGNWEKMPTRAEIDELNSKRVYLNWGNTLTFTLPTGHQALVLVGNTELHILWNPADSLNQNVVWSNNGTVGTTISRGSSITEVVISRASNSTIAVLIM